jgi:ubiquinone/menaquinone biosynthesis C-methylase UbiE
MDETSLSYDRWADTYDSDRNATRDLDATAVRRAPLRLDGADVVELGCGTGKNTIWLAGRARDVLALDFSERMLERAKAAVTSPSVRFRQHDIREPWPAADRSADVVIGNLVLEHVRDLAPVYAEAARVLRPGGQLYLCELHPFRQLAGGRAHFTDPATGMTVNVPVHLHTVSEFVNGGIQASLILVALEELCDPGAEEAPPRLLSVLFERPR